MAAGVAGLAGAWLPGWPQATAPGRMKVPPCDMADIGVVDFIDVFLSSVGSTPLRG